MAPATVAALYPKLSAYRELVQRLDPRGKFRNEMVERYVFAPRLKDARESA